jgi:hypothetical protein
MMRLIKVLAFLGAAVGGALDASAFSLRGPAAAWMTTRLGYDVGNNPLTGPMNLGEEYRWNVNVVYWAVTPDFLNYYGERGAAELEKAMEILNAVPHADELNLSDYPLRSQRINHRAEALLLRDLKSAALTATLINMGAADPSRFVFTLRSRWTTPGTTNFFVVKRNFDPVTWEPSSIINGQLWTYTTILDGDTRSLAINEPVDPLALGGIINAPVTAGLWGGQQQAGGFWTGLTRDDVAALKYIYRSDNFNVESAPTNALAAGFGGPAEGGSPWTVPIGQPQQGGTGGAAVPAVGGTNFVSTALRPGVGRIQFRRAYYNSQLGFFITNTVSFSDTIVTNGRAVSQSLIRSLISPDILFDGQDLIGGDNGDVWLVATETIGGATAAAGGGTAANIWVNNDTINGQTGNLGPGVIPPSDAGSTLTLTFNTAGPGLFNFLNPPFLSEGAATDLPRWGSFDGTTNAPVIYPSGVSIRSLEETVLGSSSPAGGLLDPFNIPIPVPTTGNAGGGAGGGAIQ